MSEDFTDRDQSDCETSDVEVGLEHTNTSGNIATAAGCSSQCCVHEERAFQPNDKPTLQLLHSKNRNFQLSWYKQFPWLSVCTNRKKVFCFYCQYAVKHNWLTFCKTREDVFTEKGFQNWKKL